MIIPVILICSRCEEYEDGKRLYPVLKQALETNEKKIVVNFLGIQVVTPSFLAAAFGKTD